MRRLVLGILAALAPILAAAWLALGTPVLAQTETTILGDLLSRALSTPTSRVSIGAVDGALSSDATIRNVVVSDADGPWLRLDRARLTWRRAALFSRRLEVDRLEVGRLEILRRPAPGEGGQPASNEPLLPELPLKVEIKAFTLGELALGEPVAGVAARLAASGAARLGPPAEGLDLTLDARRLDPPGGRAAIRLSFQPQGERLDLAVQHDEPAGGLAARLAGLPGLPPVRLDLSGTGVLDDWRATLDLGAGPDLGAEGRARLARQGGERRLTLNLDARIEALLPGAAAPVFSGVTRLEGSTRFRDDGGIAIEALALTSRLARLDVTGTLTADRILDVAASARAVPNEGTGSTRALEAEIDRLAFAGSAKGPLAAPRIGGRLEAAGVRAPQGRLGQLTAQIVAEPVADAGSALRISADATASGIAPADPGLARAVGDSLALQVRATTGADGDAAIETLRLTGSAVDLAYSGRLGPSRVEGGLDLTVGDLARWADVARQPGLAGAARLRARLAGDPSDRLAADLDGSAERLTLGIAAADRLAGGRLALTGRAEWLARDGGVAARDLRLQGAAFTALANGRAVAGAADLGLTLALSDLRRLDEGLAGRAEAEARLTGPLASPDLTAAVTIAEASALKRPLRGVSLTLEAKDLAGRLDALVRLTGRIGGEPLAGGARLRRPDPAGYGLEELSLAVGGTRLAGRAALDGAGLADGVLTIASPDLDDLSPLLLRPIKGRLEGTLTLSRDAGRQGVRLVAKGQGVEGAGVRLDNLDADAGAADLYGRPILDGRIAAEGLRLGTETLGRVRLSARGTPAASELDLSAVARGFELGARARLVPSDPTRIDLATLAAQRGAQRFALAAPASITIDGGSATISDALITTAGGGRLRLQGTVGVRLDLALAIQAVPLSVAEIVQPGLGLAGTLSGEARLRGSPARPEGDYRLSLARLATPETRRAGLPPIEAGASGTLRGTEATIAAAANAGSLGRLQADGRIPLDTEGALAVKVTGQLDAALANAALSSAGGQRVTGRLSLDAFLAGPLRKPDVAGALTLSGGTFTDPLQGVRLTGIEGRLSGRGGTVVVERLTATARNGGTIRGAGRVALDPQAGFPGDLRLEADRAELVASEVVTAVASLDLRVQGPLASRPRVQGRVDLVSMDIAIPDRLPTTVRPLAGTRHVGAPPHVQARLAARRDRPAGRGGRPAAFDAALDVTVTAPNRIFVRGRGLDAELGGEVRLTGTSGAPVAIGAFDLRRGRLSVAGQRIDLTRGRLSFAGDLVPDLDLLAATRAGDVTAQVAITGPAAQPAFTITSEPALPQDEVLARLLFAKASGNLSAFQALQLAQAVAQFSGGGGPDVFDRTRRALGVDSLDITTGANGGPAVGASRYIGDRLSVGVRAGARPEDSAATATIDVTRRLKVQGEVGADGRSSLGVGAEWEY